MSEEIEDKVIIITIKGNDFTKPEIEVQGDFNASQSRRALTAASRHIRVEATRAFYERQYAEEGKEEAAEKREEAKRIQRRKEANDAENKRIAEELEENADTDAGVNESTEDATDEDLPEKEDEEVTEEDDNDLSYLNDSDNGDKKEE